MSATFITTFRLSESLRGPHASRFVRFVSYSLVTYSIMRGNLASFKSGRETAVGCSRPDSYFVGGCVAIDGYVHSPGRKPGIILDRAGKERVWVWVHGRVVFSPCVSFCEIRI